LWIETDGRIVVLLPGPPRELQAMFEASVQPGLAERTGGRGVRRRVLKMTGRPESQVEEIAEPVYHGMAAWPIPVQTTILAAPGQIELHLSARGSDGSAIDRALDNAVQQLTTALGDIVFSTDGRQLAEVVGTVPLRRSHRRRRVLARWDGTARLTTRAVGSRGSSGRHGVTPMR
jgi:nicotinamide-nucleotide amidase